MPTTLEALSPLDGRYYDKTKKLSHYFSEKGLMYHRLVVEISWLQSLAEHPEIENCPPLSHAMKESLKMLLINFDEKEATRIKTIEKTVKHDVKAIEYYLQEKLKNLPQGAVYISFVHFALTSEDVNNIAYALMIKSALSEILLPTLNTLRAQLIGMAKKYATTPMLSKTHGQAASPTTVGKEFANFAMRLKRPLEILQNLPILAKCNGAVGNFNAHLVAYPSIDWQLHAKTFIADLGLTFQAYSTQIEPHDGLAELCHTLIRINNILLDYACDTWLYVAFQDFTQKKITAEVGSSTMPHKINPIDFENAEGNLGVSNALLDYFANKLTKSRLQRDLSDSTVLRNIGVAFGHTIIAWQALITGTEKLEVNTKNLKDVLNQHIEVLAEAIQTVMRCHGITDAYEQLKALTRGEAITKAELEKFIIKLDLPNDVKKNLLSLTPETYLGLSETLARDAS